MRDGARLDWLETALPPDRFALMLGAFVDGTAQRIARLGPMAAAGDLDGLRHDAHNMISICGNLGEVRVQILAEKLQAACIEGDRAAVDALVPAIEDAARNAVAFMRARLAARDVVRNAASGAHGGASA
ncbi:MAG: Hpt domain-containing protein [Aliidongia sp.]